MAESWRAGMVAWWCGGMATVASCGGIAIVISNLQGTRCGNTCAVCLKLKGLFRDTEPRTNTTRVFTGSMRMYLNHSVKTRNGRDAGDHQRSHAASTLPVPGSKDKVNAEKYSLDQKNPTRHPTIHASDPASWSTMTLPAEYSEMKISSPSTRISVFAPFKSR